MIDVRADDRMVLNRIFFFIFFRKIRFEAMFQKTDVVPGRAIILESVRNICKINRRK